LDFNEKIIAFGSCLCGLIFSLCAGLDLGIICFGVPRLCAGRDFYYGPGCSDFHFLCLETVQRSRVLVLLPPEFCIDVAHASEFSWQDFLLFSQCLSFLVLVPARRLRGPWFQFPLLLLLFRD
jgi:hypothetical protein